MTPAIGSHEGSSIVWGQVETDEDFEVFWKWSEDELQKMEHILQTCSSSQMSHSVDEGFQEAVKIGILRKHLDYDITKKINDQSGRLEMLQQSEFPLQQSFCDTTHTTTYLCLSN